uniref:Uncharacterized protein n=1 Tax=Timema shepardi TaxID=629360 RepID=A0A7R9AK01_TIMSH|nr:unnamed protein product [Timema shepardi]
MVKVIFFPPITRSPSPPTYFENRWDYGTHLRAVYWSGLMPVAVLSIKRGMTSGVTWQHGNLWSRDSARDETKLIFLTGVAAGPDKHEPSSCPRNVYSILTKASVEPTFSSSGFLTTLFYENLTVSLDEVHSVTSDGVDTVDQSPDASDDPTTSAFPTSRSTADETPIVLVAVQATTTHDTPLPPTKLFHDTPLPYYLKTKSFPIRSKFLDKVSLGPVEISSILQQIMTSSSLTNKSVARNASTGSTNNRSSRGGVAVTTENIDTKTTLPTVEIVNNAFVYRDTNFSDGNSQTVKDVNFEDQMEIRVISTPEDERVHKISEDTNNPYSHWDIDSEEQEKEMELQQRLLNDPAQEETKKLFVENKSEDTTTPGTPSPTGRSYLLLLAGNSTIVQLRQRDFAKYLKLNLAARLSLEYDDVRVNRVVLAPPRLLVNVSVVTPSDAEPLEEIGETSVDEKEEAPLHMLADTNATLLELSGEEYHVVRLLSLRSSPPGKDSNAKEVEEDEEDDVNDGDDIDADDPSSPVVNRRHDDIELVIYTTVGGACIFVIAAMIFLTVTRHIKTLDIPWPWKRPKCIIASWSPPNLRMKHHRIGEDFPPPPPPPKVIYSGTFAAKACVGKTSWADDLKPSEGKKPVPGHVIGINRAMKPHLLTDLDVGGNMMMGYAEMEAANNARYTRISSPSKLHIFSCRPGSVLIPLPPPVRASNMAANRGNKDGGEVHPLDVRIKEESSMGHDNPNYQT